MTAQLTAFRWVPPFAQGYVRDLRVRWALEEAGSPYEVVLVDRQDLDQEAHRDWQPFGQVPAYRDDEAELFESGAIVLHIARKSDVLAPHDPAGWASTTAWVIAALNSVEPHAMNVVMLDGVYAGESWIEDRRPSARATLDNRLASLCAWMEGRDYLVGRFTVADIIMATVLRELVDSGVLARFPMLDDYRRRCVARPAFQRALDAQLQTFQENAPA
jgi:glutathione S-transferase